MLLQPQCHTDQWEALKMLLPRGQLQIRAVMHLRCWWDPNEFWDRAQQSHSATDRDGRAETCWKRWSWSGYGQILVYIVLCCEKVLWPRSDPTTWCSTQVWNKRPSLVCWAVHCGLRMSIYFQNKHGQRAYNNRGQTWTLFYCLSLNFFQVQTPDVFHGNMTPWCSRPTFLQTL